MEIVVNNANTTIKKEILDKSIGEPGSSRRPIDLDEDEESSDGDNSVIILDSDTEAEDAGPEDDDDEEVNDEEDSDEEDEEESDDDDDDDDSESCVDSESVNSVWSSVDEEDGEKMTTEAAEAEIIKKFNKAVMFMTEKDEDRAKRIFEKLLNDPIVATYRIENPDYEIIEQPPRLARMLQVYIQSHKHLANLNPEEEVTHMCQVLAYDPNNSFTWLDVAIKATEDGDVNFAKYAFKRCESLKESYEAHATLLFVCCEYGQCLEILKTYQDEMDGLNDKMKYLKHKIRKTSTYYKALSDQIFEENDVYGNITNPDQTKMLVFDERIQILIEKMKTRQIDLELDASKKEMERMQLNDLEISICANQDLPNVCTLLCDLFDRIHTYSHPRLHLIKIIEWEDRQDYLDVVDTVSSMVEVVECVEELTEKVHEESQNFRGKKKKRNEEQKKEYLLNWKKRLFVDKATEEAESEVNTTADEEEADSQDEEENAKKKEMPENELASEFNLKFGNVVAIANRGKTRERTPPPSSPRDFIDCDKILSQLSLKFSKGVHTILELLTGVLLQITEHCPLHGALPQTMREITREIYNRLSLFFPMIHQTYHDINILAIEIGCRKAMEACTKKYLSLFHRAKDETEEENASDEPLESREHWIRFLWKYTSTELRDDVKLSYLYEIRGLMQTDEVFLTSLGSFATWDVELVIEELEKKKRIKSVKELWSSRHYKDLVVIIENDIDFNMISNEETLEILKYWTQSLEKMKKTKALTVLATRTLHFYLFTEFRWDGTDRLENLIESLLMKLHDKRFRKVDDEVLSNLGYLICLAMKKYPKKIEKNWKNWAILYEIVKVRRGPTEEYLEELDKDENPHAMPLLELDLLVKAHEVLGEMHCCAQDNYHFLLFFIDRVREMTEDIKSLEVVYEKDGGWLWTNVNEELSQVLFCMYGKYGKRKKAAEDHENGGICSANLATARRVIPVILVQPLPLYDEKEKLMHDVVDLINSKFPFLLAVDPEKKRNIDEFSAILKASNSLEDVNKGLKKCRGVADEEDSIQSLVWYALALNAYRASSHRDAVKYAELYLLTEDSASDDRLRGSVWGMLAHGNFHNLFQRDLHEIHEQWKWRIVPFRMAVDAQEHEPVPHFEFAATLYQIATSLSRFYRHLPVDDARKNEEKELPKLRLEAREQLDRSLELTKLGDDGSQPEHQWLCYFFTGKLEAKSSNCDIVKVVESFYEAACGCELAGFYYPQKVQTKKQTNFEPLEVHYQVHAAVYKYLLKYSDAPLETLRKLRVLLKVVKDGHKVVKPNNSLFKVNLDVYATVDSLVFDTVKTLERADGLEVDETEDIRKELKEFCYQAFTLVSDRFPHVKSYFRLAQMAFEKGQMNVASDNIFKNVFKRKKKDEGMFENVVEISCNDINRNGSFNFHIWRCLNLGVQVAQRLLDLHNIVAVLVTMVNIITKDDEEHVLKVMWKTLVTLYLEAMEHVVKSRDLSRNTPSPVSFESGRKKPPHLSQSTLRCELWRLWNTIQKCSTPDDPNIKMMKVKTEEAINHVFKSVSEFRSLMTSVNNDGTMRKKYTVQKRKLDVTNHEQLKKLAEQLGGPAALTMLINKSLSLSTPSAGPSTSSNTLSPSSSSVDGPLAAIFQKTQTAATAAASAVVKPVVQKPVAQKPVAQKPVAAQPPKAPVQPIYLPLSDSDDDDIQCIEPPAKKPAAAPVPNASISKPTPSLFQTPTKTTMPVQKVTDSPTSKQQVAIPKPAVSAPKSQVIAPKPQKAPSSQTSKPTTSARTFNDLQQQQAAALALAMTGGAHSSSQFQQALLGGITSKNENTRLLALHALQAAAQASAKASADAQNIQLAQAFQAAQAVQAVHAVQAAKNAQSAQEAKNAQAAQAAKNALTSQAPKNAQVVKNVQSAQRGNNAQASQAARNFQSAQGANNAPASQAAKNFQSVQATKNAQASQAARNAQAAQASRIAQAAQAAQAAKIAEIVRAAQAAQAAQPTKTVQPAAVVRPTPVRPKLHQHPMSSGMTSSASSSQLPQQRLSTVARPLHASSSTLLPTSAPVRPTPVRPTTSGTSSSASANAIASVVASVAAAQQQAQVIQSLQLINSIQDPATRETLMKQFFGNK